MAVSDRDVYAAITDLADGIDLVRDPLERVRLVALTRDLMTATLGEATDKAVYDVRCTTTSIRDTAAILGVRTTWVKDAINRHCTRRGIPTPFEMRYSLDYVPII